MKANRFAAALLALVMILGSICTTYAAADSTTDDMLTFTEATDGSAALTITPQNSVNQGDFIILQYENAIITQEAFDALPAYISAKDNCTYATACQMLAIGMPLEIALRTIMGYATNELPYELVLLSPTEVKINLFPIDAAYCTENNPVASGKPYYNIDLSNLYAPEGSAVAYLNINYGTTPITGKTRYRLYSNGNVETTTVTTTETTTVTTTVTTTETTTEPTTVTATETTTVTTTEPTTETVTSGTLELKFSVNNSDKLKVGDEFVLNLDTKNAANAPFSLYRLLITYNPTVIEAIEAVDPASPAKTPTGVLSYNKASINDSLSYIPENATAPAAALGSSTLTYALPEGESITADGTMLAIKFIVKGEGNASLNLSVENFGDLSGNPIEVKYTPFKLNIAPLLDFITGDVNIDKQLTAEDSAFLLQRVLNPNFALPCKDAYPDRYMYIADVDADYSLTANDSAFILQKVLSSGFELTIDNTIKNNSYNYPTV